MKREESMALLDARWPEIERIVKDYGGDPATDLQGDGLVVHVRIWSRLRPVTGADPTRDLYLFQLDFVDYDDHAPRVCLCDPTDPSKVGSGKQFYPLIEGNGVFTSDTFLCMPGDRRCYEQGNHAEWIQRCHFHPEIVIQTLFELLRLPGYKGRMT